MQHYQHRHEQLGSEAVPRSDAVLRNEAASRSNAVPRLGEVLNGTYTRLEGASDEHARLSAELILSVILALSRSELYLNFDRGLTQEELHAVHEAVERRAAGEPIQYVLGQTTFRHIVLRCEPGVLIPRPETEVLVDCVLQCLDETCGANSCNVLEIGCGTGCIALSLASERADTHVIATDISPAAVRLATHNRNELNDVFRPGSTVDIVACNLADAVSEAQHNYFDVLVSNPPYIPVEVLNNEVPAEVTNFEPHLALDGGADGLDVFRDILMLAPKALKPGGSLCVELFEGSLEEAGRLVVQQGGWQQANIVEDLTHRPRVLVARRENKHG